MTTMTKIDYWRKIQDDLYAVNTVIRPGAAGEFVVRYSRDGELGQIGYQNNSATMSPMMPVAELSRWVRGFLCGAMISQSVSNK